MSLATKRFVDRSIRDAQGLEHPRRLDLSGTGGMDYDYLFVGTTKVTPPARTTNFLQITLGASPSAAWVAAMPATEGSNTVTIDVTKNRIYIPGEFAG